MTDTAGSSPRPPRREPLQAASRTTDGKDSTQVLTAAPPPGWWQASDGNWYPPQPPPPPGPTYYAAPQGPSPMGYVPAAAASNGWGVAALVLSIIGVLFGLIPLTFFFAWLLGGLGLIFGFVGRSRAKRVLAGKKSSTAGVILGFAAIALGVIGVAIIANAVNDLDKKIGTADANDYVLTGTNCSVQNNELVFTGTLENTSGVTRGFMVNVDFVDSSGVKLSEGIDYVSSLKNHEQRPFRAAGFTGHALSSVTCRPAVR